MEIIEQVIRLQSKHDFGRRLPPLHIGHLFVELPQAIGQSVSMAILNRSSLKGPKPDWLRRSSEIRFVGHENGDGVALHFECARLRDTAPELFQQKTLFPELLPDPGVTGFDLFGSVLDDIREGRDDSDHLDSALLNRVTRFRKFFARGPFEQIKFSNCGHTGEQFHMLTPAMVNSAKEMLGRTPAPQRIRLVGELDGIEASTQRFSLLLDGGEKVTGVFSDEQIDVMQSFWRKRVLVLGTAVYRTSGRLLRIEAEEIRLGEGEPSIFSRLPAAKATKLDSNRLKRPQGKRSGMAAIAGAWPGHESDEEIDAALEQLS